MDPEVSTDVSTNDAPKKTPNKRNYMLWIMLFGVAFVIFMGIRFKRSDKPKIVAEIPQISAPDISSNEPFSSYDVYGEIKRFMDKQTRYVMG